MKIVVVSDTHINSTLGLWPPNFLAEQATPKPQNKFQGWLWDCWLDFCEYTHTLGEHAVVINGDLIQGIKPNRDIQLMTVNRAEQLRAARTVFSPLLKRVTHKYVVKGTEWHEGPAGEEVEELAETLNASAEPNTGEATYWYLRLRMDGKLFAFAHHTSVTTVYHSTPPTREWREAYEMKVNDSTEVPDCIVRSHVHRFGVVPDATGERLYFTTPGWQLKNAHAFKAQPLKLPNIGGLVVWVEDGQIKYTKRVYHIPLAEPISLLPSRSLKEPSRRASHPQATSAPRKSRGP